MKYHTQRFCCFITDQESLTGCPNDAEWVLTYDPFGLDDYTETCMEHLGPMLTDANEHRIYPIAREEVTE